MTSKKMALKENFYRRFLYTISDNIEVCIVVKIVLDKVFNFLFFLASHESRVLFEFELQK